MSMDIEPQISEKPPSERSPREQIAHLKAKIAEAEAAGKWSTTAGYKATLHATLVQHTDANGNTRIPTGNREVTEMPEQIRADNLPRRAMAEDHADPPRDDSESGSAPRRGAPGAALGARAGLRKRRRHGSRADQILAAEANGDFARSSRLKAQMVYEDARRAR